MRGYNNKGLCASSSSVIKVMFKAAISGFSLRYVILNCVLKFGWVDWNFRTRPLDSKCFFWFCEHFFFSYWYLFFFSYWYLHVTGQLLLILRFMFKATILIFWPKVCDFNLCLCIWLSRLKFSKMYSRFWVFFRFRASSSIM